MSVLFSEMQALGSVDEIIQWINDHNTELMKNLKYRWYDSCYTFSRPLFNLTNPLYLEYTNFRGIVTTFGSSISGTYFTQLLQNSKIQLFNPTMANIEQYINRVGGFKLDVGFPEEVFQNLIVMSRLRGEIVPIGQSV